MVVVLGGRSGEVELMVEAWYEVVGRMMVVVDVMEFIIK